MKTAISKKSEGASVAQINSMTGRAGNIGAARLQIEEVLEKADQPQTRAEIAKAAGVHETTAGHIINDMVMRGIVWNTVQARNRVSEYILSSKRDKEKRKSPERYIPPTHGWTYQGPKSARAGGDDHEAIPSRRAHGLEAHRPMMLMASKVKGGETAR